MNSYIVQLADHNREELIDNWLQQISRLGREKNIRKISEEIFLNKSREFIHIILTNMKNDKEDFTRNLSSFAQEIRKIGWSLTYVTEGLQVFRRVARDMIVRENMDAQTYVKTMEEIDEWIDPIVNEIISLYSGDWENTVSLQKMALLELSAPLIPVFENITVMPLIGTIDTERAKQIMDNLLHGVVKHRAEVVLIDITGVPVVDTMVAHYIIQAAEAVRLVGSQCMLVGIRPEIAQTIVNLGINLNKFVTKNTLKKGIEAALEMTSRKIIHVTQEESV